MAAQQGADLYLHDGFAGHQGKMVAAKRWVGQRQTAVSPTPPPCPAFSFWGGSSKRPFPGLSQPQQHRPDLAWQRPLPPRLLGRCLLGWCSVAVARGRRRWLCWRQCQHGVVSGRGWWVTGLVGWKPDVIHGGGWGESVWVEIRHSGAGAAQEGLHRPGKVGLAESVGWCGPGCGV